MKFGFLIEALFPQRCLRCRAACGGALCPRCRGGIAVHTSFFCGRCKARIPAASGGGSGIGRKDGRGMRDVLKICHKDVPYILGAAASYGDETVRTLVHHLKFGGIRNAAEPLAAIMAEYFSAIAANGAAERANRCVVPVPLSARRERERGFNQSALIGKIFAERAGMPFEAKTLFRVRHASPQSAARNVRERAANVRGCFAAPAGSFRGKTVILIDDVTTSGATFSEAAAAAKNAGAAKIIALAAAMT